MKVAQMVENCLANDVYIPHLLLEYRSNQIVHKRVYYSFTICSTLIDCSPKVVRYGKFPLLTIHNKEECTGYEVCKFYTRISTYILLLSILNE